MHLPINVKSPNNISKWRMGINSAFKVLSKKYFKGHFTFQILDEDVGSYAAEVIQVSIGVTFQFMLKNFGADSVETISDINHLKKTTQFVEGEATETYCVRNEEMTGGQRSTTVFVFHHQILFG
jgi:hypothetical protein